MRTIIGITLSFLTLLGSFPVWAISQKNLFKPPSAERLPSATPATPEIINLTQTELELIPPEQIQNLPSENARRFGERIMGERVEHDSRTDAVISAPFNPGPS